MVCPRSPAVPSELGAQRKFGGTLKKFRRFRAVVCAPQLQNRVGAYGTQSLLKLSRWQACSYNLPDNFAGLKNRFLRF